MIVFENNFFKNNNIKIKSLIKNFEITFHYDEYVKK